MKNVNGNFALFHNTGSSVEELDRYDERQEAIDALNALLGATPTSLAVQDLKAREEVYRVDWQGAAPAEPEAPAKK